jgi:hypothetical protein
MEISQLSLPSHEPRDEKWMESKINTTRPGARVHFGMPHYMRGANGEAVTVYPERFVDKPEVTVLPAPFFSWRAVAKCNRRSFDFASLRSATVWNVKLNCGLWKRRKTVERVFRFPTTPAAAV